MLMALYLGQLAAAQALYRAFPSAVLKEDRNLKILKPRNYSNNTKKYYPLIIVLDGDYLFEPVAGAVDYLSYWDQMPESFVVGINQGSSRYDDTNLNIKTGFPDQNAMKFMDFIIELKETMMDEYRVVPFTVIVGKDINANLASFYLMKKEIEVNALIQVAPEYTTIIQKNLIEKINQLAQNQFFYAAIAENESLASQIISTKVDSMQVSNTPANFKYEKITGANEYTVATQAIPRGLEFIFKKYQLVDKHQLAKDHPIPELTEDEGEPKKERESIPVLKDLILKYETINELYGINPKIRIIDLVTIAEFAIAREDWDQLIDIGRLAEKEHKNLLYGHYLQGLGYEGMGRFSRAIKELNAAYSLNPAAGITKEMILDKVEYLQSKE